MFKILRNFILVLLFITPIIACSQCNVTNGNYSSSGGSEQSTTLSLSNNNDFYLQYENWQPGNYESREINKIKGVWECKGKLVTIELNGVKISAKKIIIGKNPLGLGENTKALQFTNAPVNSFLFNEILYLTPE